MKQEREWHLSRYNIPFKYNPSPIVFHPGLLGRGQGQEEMCPGQEIPVNASGEPADNVKITAVRLAVSHA